MVIAFQKEGLHKIRWERRKIDLDSSYLFLIRYDIVFRDVSWLEQKIMKPSLDGYSDLCNKSIVSAFSSALDYITKWEMNLSSDIERKWKENDVGLNWLNLIIFFLYILALTKVTNPQAKSYDE